MGNYGFYRTFSEVSEISEICIIGEINIDPISDSDLAKYLGFARNISILETGWDGWKRKVWDVCWESEES